MRSVTASEASRDFDALLDAVEAGETIEVTRHGVPVACLAPKQTNTAARIAEVLAHPVDPDWADDLEKTMRELRSETTEEREWPDN